MYRYIPAALVVCLLTAAVLVADDSLIEALDTNRFQAPKEKGKAELVEGKIGKAVRFSFDEGARGVFFTSNLRGTPAWDKAAGLSFWVRGDGSDNCGSLHLIYDDDFAVRYDCVFPIREKEWTKVVVPWRDLVPVLPGPKSKPLDPAADNTPSKISAVWVGKWWYWGDYPAYSFALDEMRLEEKIDLDNTDYKPKGAPLKRVLDKLKAGKPITVVTMGDSLTDTRHWANRETNWPALLKKQLEEEYKGEVTLVNPAIGGTQLRQNLALMPRWLAKVPEPDLVTICFGGNDWESGMRAKQFAESYRDAVDRIRRATRGKTEVLILTSVPSVEQWTTRAELAEACREAARERNAGLADTEKAFLKAGKADKEKLYVRDMTHLSPTGHALMAQAVLEALERAGR